MIKKLLVTLIIRKSNYIDVRTLSRASIQK